MDAAVRHAFRDPTWPAARMGLAGQDTGRGVPQFDHDPKALATVFGHHPVAAACARANAITATQAPLRIRRVTVVSETEVEAEVLDYHPVLDILERPNPRQTGEEWRVYAGIQLEVFGQAFNVLDVTAGRPEIWPMAAGRVNVKPSNQASNPIAGYSYEAAGKVVDLAPGPVVHAKYPGPWPENELHGHSKLRDLYPTLMLSSFQDRWLRQFFENAAVMSGVLEVPGELSDTSYKRLQAALSERMGKRLHEPYIAEGGAKWQRTQATIKEIMPTDLDESNERRILAVMGTPRVALNFPETNFATAREQVRSWWQTTLAHLNGALVAALNVSPLMAPYRESERRWLEIFADTSMIDALQKDAVQQATVDQIYIGLKVYGPEYVRQREGWPEPEEPEEPEMPAPPEPPADEEPAADPEDEAPPEESQEGEAEQEELSDAMVPVAVVWPALPGAERPPREMVEYCEKRGLLLAATRENGHWESPIGDVPAAVVADTFERGPIRFARLRPGAARLWETRDDD